MMSDDELLIAYVMDELPDVLRKEVEERARIVPQFARLLEETEAAFGAISLALPPVSPSPERSTRFYTEIKGSARWFPFIDRLARLFDVAAETAAEFLGRLNSSAGWEEMPFPSASCALMHLTGGPSTVHADVGFVHLKAGDPFPYHVHLGDEAVLILQGGLKNDDGRIYRAGDLIFDKANSAHQFEALPGEDLYYAVVVQNGVDFPGISWRGTP